jgi:anaerobic ribonucleoside-triphosphate reductase activating protein
MTEAEGPGRRYALWVQGCTLRCPGCCNPEMFAADAGEVVQVAALAREVAAADVEGVSVLGGEPFEQAAAVAAFCEAVRVAGRTVMVYTGFTLEELQARGDDAVARLLSATDLLVDGRYERALPEATRRWIGSSNQRLHFLTARYAAEDPRFAAANTVELRLEGGRLTVKGWPGPADAVWRRRS